MPSLTVSIVIPAYNAESFLAECLDSVLAQTFTDWEAVVVDDGSTDSTPEIIARYAALDPRVHGLSKPNGGLSDARNFGVAHARGRWCTFLDSDDCLYPHSLTALTDAATPGIDVVIGASTVGGRCTICRDAPRCIRRSVQLANSSKVKTISSEQALLSMLYQRGLLPSAWGKLYRTDLLREVPFREGIWYEDVEFSHRLYPRVDRVAVTPAVVYFYRDNPSSFLHRFSPGRFDVLEVTRQIENEYSSRNHSLLAAARDRRLSANFNIFGLLAVHDRAGRYRDVADQCWALIRDYRLDSLLNSRVRLKNKLGILVSYLGRTPLRLLSRLIYR